MFDIGWPELLLVAIVLIIVVGPKDLPAMLRAFGRTTAKLRSMASDFRGQFDEALREAEFDEVRKTFSDARGLNPMRQIRDAVNPLKETGNKIREDLEKSVKADAPVAVPDPGLKLDDGPPKIDPPSEPQARAAEPVKAGATGAAGKNGKSSEAASKKPVAKTRAPAKATAAPAAAAKKTTRKAASASAPGKASGANKPSAGSKAGKAKPSKASAAKAAVPGKTGTAAKKAATKKDKA